MTQHRLRQIAWNLTAVVCVLTVVAWSQAYDVGKLSSYSLFPLFGLLAFALMWSHYMVALIREWVQLPKQATNRYFSVTSGAVLLLILLHPGVLIWSLWQDGLGLPPGSVELFVGKVMYGSVVLGIVALVIFWAYEARRFISDKRLKQALQYASDGAMLLIVVHGFQLGMVTRVSWFRAFWIFLAVTFVSSLLIRSYLSAKRSNEA